MRLRPTNVMTLPAIRVIRARTVINATFEPVNGSDADGVREADSLSTLAGAVVVDGVRETGVLVKFSPSTVVPPVTHCGRSGSVVQSSTRVVTQPGAVGVVVQFVPVVTQPGAVGVVVQSVPVVTQPGAVGVVVQSVPVPEPVVQPVCAGLVWPMPWLRSHS